MRACVRSGLSGLVGLALLAGCGGATSEPFDRGEFESMMNNAWVERQAMEDTMDRLGRQCVEAQGFTIHPIVDPEGVVVPATSPDFEIRMGARTIFLTDAEIAESGYGASPTEAWGFDIEGEDNPHLDDQFKQLDFEEQEAYYLALDGDFHNLYGEEGENRSGGLPYPTKGCMADIQETVFDGEVAEYHEQALVARDGLTRFIIDNVDAHPEVVDLEAAWLDCLHDNGYPDLEEGYHPVSYARDMYFDEDIYSPDDPRFADTKAAEIVLAQTDADCNREVGLDDTRTDIFWTVVEEYFHQFEVQLFTWTETVSQANLRAQNVLAEYENPLAQWFHYASGNGSQATWSR